MINPTTGTIELTKPNISIARSLDQTSFLKRNLLRWSTSPSQDALQVTYGFTAHYDGFACQTELSFDRQRLCSVRLVSDEVYFQLPVTRAGTLIRTTTEWHQHMVRQVAGPELVLDAHGFTSVFHWGRVAYVNGPRPNSECILVSFA